MTEFNLFKLIKEGTKAVPATKYAVGIAGIFAIVAIIGSFKIDLRIALWGTIILLGLMVLLVIFAKLSQTASEDFKIPVKILMWSFTMIFIIISVLLTSSVFFKFPVDLQFILTGNHSKTELKEVVEPPKDSKKADSVKKNITYRQAFGFNYMRLFGAGGVPCLMEIIESKTGIAKTTDYPVYHIKGKKNSSYVSNELAEFWINKWEYKEAVPVKTKLWEKFCGNIQSGFDIYWTSLSSKTEDAIAYASFIGNEVGGWDGDLPLKLREEMERFVDSANKDRRYSSKYVDFFSGEELGVQSNDIGYLFLILTNTTESEISDINVLVKEFYNRLKIEKKNYSIFKTRSNPKVHALTDDSIRVTKNYVADTLMIASLKPQKSIIWFLGAYKKNENSLPDFYLTNVVMPQKIIYRAGPEIYYDTVRQPYGIKAARLYVPNGWYNQ